MAFVWRGGACPLVVDVHPARSPGDRLRRPRLLRSRRLGSPCWSACSPRGRSSTARPTWSPDSGAAGRDRSWWLAILEGIVGIVAGVIALLFPRLRRGGAGAHHRRLGDHHRHLRDRGRHPAARADHRRAVDGAGRRWPRSCTASCSSCSPAPACSASSG